MWNQAAPSTAFSWIIYYGRADAVPASAADGLDAGLVYLTALALLLVLAIQLLPKKGTEEAA
ncbi:hypothetical protein ACFVRD_09125 [Streptomyces sp. NPDC057908]|uniref:hypothetical protein n=1 Tax=Streptomyces sp. NPDC057908 TaxID=3346276 RepID=UPI0036ED4DDA